jgi:molybdate transport system substrate-binding protein
MKNIKKLTFLFISLIIFNNLTYANDKPKLIFYCGITMVKPMQEISKIIEKKYNCIIKISQGGSEDLYRSLSYSKKGDLYLPGSHSYINKYKKYKYFEKSSYIGFNQAAIFVQKNNPKNIKNLDDLLRDDISIILGDPNSGSIGTTTKNILIKYKGEEFFDDVYNNTVTIGTDSRSLNKAMKTKDADVVINWKATAYWPENKKDIDIIEIDEKYAMKKKLIISLLSFSKNKKIANEFINFTLSEDGQNIIKKYGFK